MISYSKQSLVAAVLLVVLAGSIAAAPFSARAQLAVFDAAVFGQEVLQLIQLVYEVGESVVQTAIQYSIQYKEYILDPAVKLLASIMLQNLTRAIIEWIQGGGNTNFVANLEGALRRAADEAAGEFLNQLAGANLCQPFSVKLRLELAQPTIRFPLYCSATRIFDNLQTTYEQFLSDFTSGGWIAFQSTLSGPNNYIDALISGLDSKLVAESRRTSTLLTQYQAGRGFLGVRIKKKVCQDFAMSWDDCPTVDIQTTPGGAVAHLLNESLSSGIAQAVAADEIAEAIDAIITAAINRLISSAIAGLAEGNEASGLYDPNFSDLSPPPPAPTLPEIASIREDIIRVDAKVAEISSAIEEAGRTVADIDSTLRNLGSFPNDPSVSELRILKSRLEGNIAGLNNERITLAGYANELESIQAQINVITSDPTAPVDQFTQLLVRSRRITQEVDSRLRDTTGPLLSDSRAAIGRARELIALCTATPSACRNSSSSQAAF